ncbi:MAG: BON domain-containing protein, partial [Candidatus Thermoplasmatota archaeon]|nr:BON domain-containing protein [Candidatus Thermoplasmatota archaeon]
KIAWNPNLNAFKIDVEVKDGTVTLKGTVDSYWKKMDAESEAQRVFGVFTVSNELGIAPTKNYLDEEIAKDIMRAIERKPTVPEDDVNVVVENGKVTLTGHVPSRLSSYAAMNAAIHTLGVKEVTNRMMVKK